MEMPDQNIELLTGVIVPQQTRVELAQQHSEAESLRPRFEALPCDTPDQESIIAAILQEVKGRLAELETSRKSITQPLAQVKAAVDALFRPMKEAWEEAEQVLKGKLAMAEERRREASAARLDAAKLAASQGDAQGARDELVARAHLTAQAAPEGIQYRKSWTWTVNDLSKVPREWLSLDHSKAKIYCKEWQESDQIPEVPGLTFRREVSVVSRVGRGEK